MNKYRLRLKAELEVRNEQNELDLIRNLIDVIEELKVRVVTIKILERGKKNGKYVSVLWV